jgi:elongation factor 1-gamma
MASGTLYTYPSNFRAYKALVAAQYSGAQVKTVSQPPEFIFGETNKTDAFVKKFPFGKVPAFESSDGKCILYESNAIAHYVGNDQLRGQNVLDQAQILKWINIADNEILPAACTWVFPCLGIYQYNKQSTDRAKDDIKKVLSVLDQHLSTRTYLVGERITQADIAVSCNLFLLYEHVLDPAFREPYVNTNRWFTTLINQPQFKAVIGDFKLCEKMAQFDAKKFAELQGKGKEKKADKPEKDQKPKKEKQDKPKEDKKPAAAGGDAAEELDETEAILAAEPKSRDPFEKFNKGTFNMDDFKRVYSNEAESVSIPYFWEKLDKENYSIWYCEYKYPKELTLIFMSCNLITGMFQRLDKMRKNAFGSMILFGKDHDSSISGIWVWKGDELAFNLSSDWQVDYESYSWKRLDANSPDTRKMVDEYFSWTGDFGGKKFNQGKIFK